jgi:hypothetical protein
MVLSAMDIFTQIIDQGVPADKAVYPRMIHGFSVHGVLVKDKDIVFLR